MNKAYLLIGSNIGDRKLYLLEAKHFLNAIGHVAKASSIYETAAWGKTNQATFLNQALLLETLLEATELLNNILGIEEKMGRKRLEQYGSRIIDIDILLFNDDVINTPTLTVPHPAMVNRSFTLIPLAEIASNIVHPVYNKTIQILLKECTDMLSVEKFIG